MESEQEREHLARAQMGPTPLWPSALLITVAVLAVIAAETSIATVVAAVALAGVVLLAAITAQSGIVGRKFGGER